MQFVSGACAFRCVVMGANTKRCLRTQNEIISFKRELPVKTLKHPYSYVTTLDYHGAFSTFTQRKGIPHVHDSVKYLDYFHVTLSCNFVYGECTEQY